MNFKAAIEAVKENVRRTQEWRANPVPGVLVRVKARGSRSDPIRVINIGKGRHGQPVAMCCVLRDGKSFGPQHGYLVEELILA